MRQTVWGVIASIIIIYITAIMMTEHGRSLRQTEVSNNLSEALQITLNQLQERGEECAASDAELSSLFLEELLLQCGSQSDITVNILGCDVRKGLLSVEVIEHYSHPNGRSGTVTARQTAVIDWEEEII